MPRKSNPSNVHKAECVWFSPKRGYGFVKVDKDGEESHLFVHQTAIQTGGFRKLIKGKTYEVGNC